MRSFSENSLSRSVICRNRSASCRECRARGRPKKRHSLEELAPARNLYGKLRIGCGSADELGHQADRGQRRTQVMGYGCEQARFAGACGLCFPALPVEGIDRQGEEVEETGGEQYGHRGQQPVYKERFVKRERSRGNLMRIHYECGAYEEQRQRPEQLPTARRRREDQGKTIDNRNVELDPRRPIDDHFGCRKQDRQTTPY
jgi:hypothetical protein